MPVENILGRGRIISVNLRARNAVAVRLKFENTIKSFTNPRKGPHETQAIAYAETTRDEAKRIVRREAYFRGRLRDSISIQTTPLGKNRTEYVVGIDTNILKSVNGYNYANAIEGGTRPHFVPLDSNPGLVRWIREKLGEDALNRYRIAETGEVFGYLRVQHPGIRFMERAYAKAFRVRKGRLQQAVEESLRTAGFS